LPTIEMLEQKAVEQVSARVGIEGFEFAALGAGPVAGQLFQVVATPKHLCAALHGAHRAMILRRENPFKVQLPVEAEGSPVAVGVLFGHAQTGKDERLFRRVTLESINLLVKLGLDE